MKKTGSYVFLLLFVLNIAGCYIYFFIRLQQIKGEMRAELQTKGADELEVLRLTEREFLTSRVEEDEIKVDGKMFDIAFIEREGNVLVVYGEHDTDEDNLLSMVDAILENALADQDEVPSSMIVLLLAAPQAPTEIPAITSVDIKPYTLYLMPQPTSASTKFYPPPRG